MDRTGWDEVAFAGLECDWWLAVDVIFHQAFEDIDDLFAGMRVSGSGYAGVDVNADLEGFVAGDTEVVSLKIGAPDGGVLWHDRGLWGCCRGLLCCDGAGDSEYCQSDYSDSAE